MPRRPAWLFLVLALAGPLMSLEDAAEGLERFLIEAGDRCEIEPPEGGIDEKPVDVPAWKASPAVDPLAFAPPALEVAWMSPPTGLLAPGPGTGRLHRDAPSWLTRRSRDAMPCSSIS